MMIARILCYQAIAVLLVTSAKEKKNCNVHRCEHNIKSHDHALATECS